MVSISIDKMKYQIRTVGRLSGEIILHSTLLKQDNLKVALLQNVRNEGERISLRINTLKLNLGVIPIAQFDTLFIPRLAQVFAERLAREQASIAGQQAVKMKTSNITESSLLLSGHHFDEEGLFQLACCCLTPQVFNTLFQDSQAYQLQQLLKRLLEGAWQSPKKLPVFWYGRVTTGRLSIAAILYLLKNQRGHDWLIRQHAPTASQVTDWAKAIAEGEIPSEQVAQLLTGNRPSDSILLGQLAYPPLVVMHWLLPLWRQPAVRQVIHRLKGRRGVQRLDAYLSLCLQRQNEKRVQSDPLQVVLPRDDTTSPKGKERLFDHQHAVLSRDNTILSACDEMRRSSQDISNAGLLLLWPLLPQLFSQLSLWEEEQFVSDDARWQAVHSLDRLVWGGSTSSDERLTLNQVLCGVSSPSPVPVAAPLSVLHQQQIDIWLATIGQQLVGWQKLSVTDIRQLFLQRAGEISTEETYPKISVCPEPYDFLLKDWPWPMTLASFPWAKQPLTIVWPLNGFTG